MSTETKEDNKAEMLEKEVKSLQYELKICNEAKTLSEACKNITEHAQEKEEPFATSHEEPNVFHKKPPGGGGGCNIL